MLSISKVNNMSGQGIHLNKTRAVSNVFSITNYLQIQF